MRSRLYTKCYAGLINISLLVGYSAKCMSITPCDSALLFFYLNTTPLGSYQHICVPEFNAAVHERSYGRVYRLVNALAIPSDCVHLGQLLLDSHTTLARSVKLDVVQKLTCSEAVGPVQAKYCVTII